MKGVKRLAATIRECVEQDYVIEHVKRDFIAWCYGVKGVHAWNITARKS